MRLLVIEDDAAVGRRVVRGLEHAGFEVEWCADGDEGLARARDGDFDLVVVDLMLPTRDGFDILRSLRGGATPLIVISARGGLESRLASFELGAADFVPKPFWMEELVARVRSRLGERKRNVVAWGEVELDLDARVVRVGGAEASLTPMELEVLRQLVVRGGRAVSRGDLAEPSLGMATERTIDSHVARIRRKLGVGGAAIRTVRGFGYRFAPEDEK